MAIPDKAELEKMSYGYEGVPFIRLTGKDTIDTKGLEYGYGGVPFYGVSGGVSVITRKAVIMVVTD